MTLLAGEPVRIGPAIQPVLPFSPAQLAHRDYIQRALVDRSLTLTRSQCFCGEVAGVTVSTHDAWGLNIPTIMCRRCFTLRSRYFLDDASMTRFYAGGYYFAHMFTARSAPGGVGMSIAEYRREEAEKGAFIYGWLEAVIDFASVKTVLDIGCGAGGVLEEFRRRGHQVSGCDFVESYINDARLRMPDAKLHVGGLEQLEGGTFDLVLLSDVVEHLSDPLALFRELHPFLHDRSLVYINVPGVFGISSTRFSGSFRAFTKIEHTWCHTLQSLDALMSAAGFERVAGNQGVLAIYRPTETRAAKERLPGPGYGAFLLTFLASLPVRQVLKLDRWLYGARRLFRR
jgi:SAM-dependent methyltransferase